MVLKVVLQVFASLPKLRFFSSFALARKSIEKKVRINYFSSFKGTNFTPSPSIPCFKTFFFLFFVFFNGSCKYLMKVSWVSLWRPCCEFVMFLGVRRTMMRPMRSGNSLQPRRRRRVPASWRKTAQLGSAWPSTGRLINQEIPPPPPPPPPPQ